jgi:ABC-type sulfate transport system permease component
MADNLAEVDRSNFHRAAAARLQCLELGLGTPLAWLISGRQSRVVRVIETMVRLPAVLRPAVAGVALLLAFGRMGLVGSWLATLGWSIPFTMVAVATMPLRPSGPRASSRARHETARRERGWLAAR